MCPPFNFTLSDEPIEPVALAAALENPAAGAVVTFEGRVRNHNAGKPVGHLEYQAYPVLANSTARKILEEESQRHGLLEAVAVHRCGPLEIGELAVWVGVASAHRGAAFDGARAIMERLKYELPIWKKETYADGTTEWVGPDNRSPETGHAVEVVPELEGMLEEIWLSDGNDLRGRHGKGRLHHPTRQVKEVECVAGMGLKGDRYFGFKPDFKGQVTFINAETLAAVRETFSLPDLTASAFRRNLVVRGADLSHWLGKRFRFQGVEFEGSEECKPCEWMNETAAPGVEEFLKPDFGGGLRARILTDGRLRVS